MGNFEKDFPENEHCIILHALIHLLGHIWKWGHCRNFHAFASERWVGYLIRYAHAHGVNSFVNNYTPC
jgi:hypothetical protein